MKGIGAHRGTLGYWLAEDYRGRGIATRAVLAAVAYAFDALGLMRVEATTFLHNLASQRVLEKCGFTREGILAGYHCKNGRLVDVVMFAIVSAAPHR
jgi:ribosomal-protein-alanine N-acetyltransferase